jgi:hypothetical protein
MCTEGTRQVIDAEFGQARAGDAHAVLKLEIRASRHLVQRLRRQFPQVPATDIAELLHDLTQDLYAKRADYGHWRQALSALKKALYRELRRQVRRRRQLRSYGRERETPQIAPLRFTRQFAASRRACQRRNDSSCGPGSTESRGLRTFLASQS